MKAEKQREGTSGGGESASGGPSHALRRHAACGCCCYTVIDYKDGWFRRQVSLLRCRFCPFEVGVRAFHRSGDRSGQGRYNRARAAMLRHLREHGEQTRVAVAACYGRSPV